MSDLDQAEKIKFLLLGNSSVGKTSLINYFTKGQALANAITTIGVDAGSKSVEIRGKPYQIQLFDTAGQERFRSIPANLYKRAHCVMIVYDVTSTQSFHDLNYWMRQIKD
jgi:small GTP-binding protein